MSQLFIGEVKTQSPFGFKSRRSKGYLLELACRHADIVSIHTDPRWGGSFDHLQSSAILVHGCGKLVLAKGIHPHDDDIRHALQCGADLVLVVDREPAHELRPVCLLEEQHRMLTRYRADRWVVNARDLATGKPTSRPSFTEQRLADERRWLCQASFIRTPGDVHPMADAFIVGEHLEEYCACLP